MKRADNGFVCNPVRTVYALDGIECDGKILLVLRPDKLNGIEFNGGNN
jgi:hypothetical protein